MIFGNKNIYAIEIYHQPIPDNSAFFMCGSMCLHLFDKALGDINDEYCSLFVAYKTLLNKVNSLNELEYEFGLDNDYSVFNFLDNKLYFADDDRTPEQIDIDWDLYSKFDFMTNAGESFDRTTSFIYMDKNKTIHILYQIQNSEIICTKLDKETFENTTKAFIHWYKETEKRKEKEG